MIYDNNNNNNMGKTKHLFGSGSLKELESLDSKYDMLEKRSFSSQQPRYEENYKAFKRRRLNYDNNEVPSFNFTNNNNENQNRPQQNANNTNIIIKNKTNKIERHIMQEIQQQQQKLPIHGCDARLIAELQNSDTLLLMGETGSGKTTQIPQMLYKAGYARLGMIAITQPRRVAAITVAKRVAYEQQTTIGDRVGYVIRFENCTSAQTRICFLTDGCLLREALIDPLLQNYSVIMLDEAHERTINTDVLFGIVKKAQIKRREMNLCKLKVIVTSATMDIDHFGRYFGVRGMYLEGRTYPVKVMNVKQPQTDYLEAILITLFQFDRDHPTSHDVLIFLTGQEEIEALAQQIRMISKTHHPDVSHMYVLPLYAQLPQNKQLRCFLPAPPNKRKVVLATNIAETSITIPGIRCVIDCGYVKRRLYTPNSGLDVLCVLRISQAQAWQRCGRAGREAPGVCYRVYTQSELATFDHMPKPEILTSNICSTYLQLLALGIDCRYFDFLDRPSQTSLEFSLQRLIFLGAVVKNTVLDKPQLTELGQKMVLFPLDPRYSKLLLCASTFGCSEEMLSLVAMLVSENVFISSAENRDLAALAHVKFNSKYGDHLTLLNVYSAFEKADNKKSWCQDNHLNFCNLQYASKVRQQLLEIMLRIEIELNSCGSNYDQVRKCLLSVLYENVAALRENNLYYTLYGRQLAKIHPSSVFRDKYKPHFLVYADIVRSDRNYLRQVTEVQFDWFSEVIPNYDNLNRFKILTPPTTHANTENRLNVNSHKII